VNRTQVIKVARGDKPGEKIVDAPKVNLPHSDSAVANLLAIQANPGPRPAEGMQSSIASRTLPELQAVAPTPEVDSSHRDQSSLTAHVVAPVPEISHASRNAASLNSAPVAPAPSASPEKMRNVGSLTPNVVAPAPRETPHDLASSRVSMSQTTEVVAPPVSAPARDLASVPKLALPVPAVIAPPPSQVSRDLNSWGSTRSGDIRTQAVPPPPSAAGGGSSSRSGTGTIATQVVPPPADIDGGSQAGGSRNGSRGSKRGGGALVGSANVVPPPPSVGGGKGVSGSGRGNKGNGAGGPLDLGSAAAQPANAGGNAASNGVVMSSQPGQKVGLPNSTGGGAIAMSPAGTARTGLGGSGGGIGIGRGNGPGSGLTGEGSGAGRDNAGTGRGSDPNAHGGISPYPGPGGAGNGTNGSPAIPGVSVAGGTTTINLPSFGAPGGDAPSNGPGHSSANAHSGSGITIEATPRSGGVFNYYGVLKGDRNYSIYIDTSIGTAVMQYADPASASRPSSQELDAPEPMRKPLPTGLRPTHVVIACILDRSGTLKNLQVLQPGAPEATSKILVALQNWKFRPAFRGNEPIEVNAILGFGIDTR
jgi:hypothetical protein